MPDFIARRSIGEPGSLVFGYRRGDVVPPQVVEAWGLVDGEDVSSRGLEDDEREAVVARPSETANRADWEAYAVANGMAADKAAAASMDDLTATESDTDQGDERPAESARKSDWVDYVVASGGDEAWARAADTTKVDLVQWTPGTPTGLPAPSEGDPVAASATQQANG